MNTELIVESSVLAEVLSRRYRAAYAAAKFVRTLGGLIRIAAIVLAVLLLIVGIVDQGEQGSGDAFATLLLAAVLTGFCGFCTGALVSASSHIIKACADLTINTSPLLRTETKEQLLSAD